MPGLRIDDVVVTHSSLIEEALVVSRSGEGRIGERNAQRDLVLAIGVADAHDPGLAETVTADTGIATGIDHGMRETPRLQDVDTTVHGIALGDATQIDAHAGLAERYGSV